MHTRNVVLARYDSRYDFEFSLANASENDHYALQLRRQALHQRHSRISQFLDDPSLSLGLDWASHEAG